MTFLELCQRLRQEAGVAGTGPVSVSSQTGEMARLVSWIRYAWTDLQSSRTDWRPLWRQLSEAVASGEDSLSAPSSLGRVLPDRFRFDGSPLQWVHWRHFPDKKQDDGAPRLITQRPDGVLVLSPAPSAGGTLTGEYYEAPQVLEVDNDEPWLPEYMQSAIIYQALIYYATYEDAPEIYQDAMAKVDQVKQRMVSELVDGVDLTGPLA